MMNVQNDVIEVRVRRVIAQVFRLGSEASQGELRMSDPPAWDSLGHMELVAALEKEFEIRFPGYLLAEIVSVPAIVREIQRLGTK
jgi:acyl carrier protein